MTDYPKAKYSKTQQHCVVNSALEEKKLVGEWFDTPNFTNNPKPGAVPVHGHSPVPPPAPPTPLTPAVVPQPQQKK